MRYTETEFDALLRDNNAFQWVMIEHWFDAGQHVVVNEAGEPVEWPVAWKRAVERNREWALDEAVRHAKKRAHLDPDKPALPEAFIEHIDPKFRQAFWDRQVDRYLDSRKPEQPRGGALVERYSNGSCSACGEPMGLISADFYECSNGHHAEEI